MLGALLYLRLTSLKNLALSRVRRLRQPKYLAGSVVGLGYFYFFFFRRAGSAFRAMNEHGAFGPLPADTSPLLLTIAGALLLTIVLGMWILPSGKPGLKFSEAEIAFLFPAPFSRRGLVHYKILNAQFSTLLQSLLYSLLFNSQRLLSGGALFVIVSWWALLSTLSLHYQASSLTIARLAEKGVHQNRRRLLVAALVLAAGAIALWTIWDVVSRLSFASDFATVIPAALHTGGPRWLLAPFELVARPFFVRELRPFLLALGPVLLVLAVHYFWVVRMNVAFEEASVASAERRASRLTEIRRSGGYRRSSPSAGRRPPFDLGRARWPELAFLWKNLLSTLPWLTPRAWWIGAAGLIAFQVFATRWLGHDYWKAGAPLSTIGAMVGAMALFYGPLLTRLDLRQDLANADLLKTYPLPGWRILLGELLAPIAVLTGIVWLALLAWYLGLKGHQPPKLSAIWLSQDMRGVIALCAAAIAPVVIAIELLVPNAMPVVFPGWFHSARAVGAGLDLMGQRLIFGFGQVLIVALSLLPAAGFAALLIFITQRFLGPAPAVALAALTVLLVLAGELWCGLWLVGERFEKFDLSAEPRT